MRIGIIGATGKAGSAVYAEAVKRGHDTTAIVRNRRKATELLGAEVQVLERDAFALTSEDLGEFETVVNAFGTAPDRAHQHVDLARHLVGIASGQGAPRLVFILGAGSLTTGDDNHLHVEDIRKAPGAEAFVSIPENQLKQLDYLRTVEGARWVGASPQAAFIPGDATKPRIGGDELLNASDGESHTTTGTMAVALLDEIEIPRHENLRIAVSDT